MKIPDGLDEEFVVTTIIATAKKNCTQIHIRVLSSGRHRAGSISDWNGVLGKI